MRGLDHVGEGHAAVEIAICAVYLHIHIVVADEVDQRGESWVIETLPRIDAAPGIDDNREFDAFDHVGARDHYIGIDLHVDGSEWRGAADSREESACRHVVHRLHAHGGGPADLCRGARLYVVAQGYAKQRRAGSKG